MLGLGSSIVKSNSAAFVDSLPGLAISLSLRLIPGGSYSGPAITVTTDGVDSQDINFNGSNLDTAALESFAGSGDAYVSTWFDQSGNSHNAIQTSFSNMPKIVSNGSTILENGKPAIEFNGSQYLYVWKNSAAPARFRDMGDAITAFIVEKATAIASAGNEWFNAYTIAEIRNNTAHGSARAPLNIGYTSSKFGFGATDSYTSGDELVLSGTLTSAQRLSTSIVDGDDLNVDLDTVSAIDHTFTAAANCRSLKCSTKPLTTFSIGSRSSNTGVLGFNTFEGTMQEITLYKSVETDIKAAVEANINSYYFSYSYLLDDYSGAAVAYSLRLLRSGYTGDAIIVTTNGTDSQSIGFVNNELDTASLETFANGGDAYVSSWLDQSGNGKNVTQTTFSAMPKIVSSGSTILENGKAAVQFDGGNDQLTSTFGTTYNQPTYSFLVHNFTSAPSAFDGVIGSIGNEHRLIVNGTLKYTLQAGGALGYNQYSTNQSLVSYKIQQSDPKLFFNETQQSISSGSAIGTTGLQGLILGGISSGSSSGNTPVQIQELVIFNSNQDSNRTGIETNINDFYSI
jgi:hypothetical protein